VTQARVARDIRGLGLEKTHDVLARPQYQVPCLVIARDLEDARAPAAELGGAIG
jgi:arginine repressor